jgi:hypothetical protein
MPLLKQAICICLRCMKKAQLSLAECPIFGNQRAFRGNLISFCLQEAISLRGGAISSIWIFPARAGRRLSRAQSKGKQN